MVGLATLFAAAALALSARPAEARVNPSFWGVVYSGLDTQALDLNRMEDGRVRSVRWKLRWPVVQPDKGGTFHWASSDAVIGRLANRGIRAFVVVSRSPHYAAETPATPPLGSGSARIAWQRFLRAAVDRYGPGGDYWTKPSLYQSQHPDGRILPVKAWQIWNEPNLDSYFAPHPSVRKYRRLLRLSYRAIHGEAPQAKIILGGLAGFGQIRAWTFLDRLYRAKGIKRKFDAAAIHPYARTIIQMQREMRRMRKVMRAHHDRHTPLWITEMGWGSGAPDGVFNKGPDGQKRMLNKSFHLLRQKRKRWHVPRLFWYQWRDPKPRHAQGQCGLCRYAGLFKHGGEPKPAWQAFQRWTGAL